MSHSLGLKYYGGGGVGVITCFEDTTGSPAKATTACDARVTTAKAVKFFIEEFPHRGFHCQLSVRDECDRFTPRQV
jgi:hypothetical protein